MLTTEIRYHNDKNYNITLWKYNIIRVTMITYDSNNNMEVTMEIQYHNGNHDNI